MLPGRHLRPPLSNELGPRREGNFPVPLRDLVTVRQDVLQLGKPYRRCQSLQGFEPVSEEAWATPRATPCQRGGLIRLLTPANCFSEAFG